MSPEIFTVDSPGVLVDTTAFEEYYDGGDKRTHEARGKAFVPNPLPPDLALGPLLEQAQGALSSADRAVGELHGLAGDISYARLLCAPLLQREAILSSKIENTIATAREVAEYQAGRTPERDDPIEVFNYRQALEYGVSSELPICVRLVKEMHSILLKDGRGSRHRPGAIRTGQNRIGGQRDDFSTARFVPPPPGEILDRCLTDLERFWNQPSKRFGVLLSVAMAHYQFEVVHPFEDGNGRIGRALVPLALCRHGLLNKPLVYVSGYFERHKQEYYDLLLRTSTHGDWAAWCRFFLTAIASEAGDAARRLRRVRELRQTTLDRLSDSNAPGRVMQLVDLLFEQTWVDATIVARNLGVSDPTARDYIGRLVDVGFLQEITGGSYAQAWAATPIFDIIESDNPSSAGADDAEQS